MDLAGLTAQELLGLYARNQASPVEAVDACLARIEAVEPKISAILTLVADRAIEQARKAAARWRRGEARPLEGVPYGLKDFIDTAGVRTTWGSPLRRDFVPTEDATLNARLAAAGGVLLAKLKTPDPTGDASPRSDALDGRPVRNPWDTSRTSGGSSSGPGAAIAAREMPVAIGTDAGGSIRGPAAYCGVYGLKPTYGRVPFGGVFSFSWTLDHAGPMARSVEDVALVLEVIAGADPRSPTSHHAPVPRYRDACHRSIRGLRIGRCDALEDRLHPGARAALETAIRILQDAGAHFVKVDLPRIGLAESCIWMIALSELSAIHEVYFDGAQNRQEMYAGVIFQCAFLSGNDYYSANDYLRAQLVRVVIQRELEAAFASCDALAVPGMASVAPLIDDLLCDLGTEKVPWVVDSARTTGMFNITGNPALMVPAGLVGGMPVGFQLVGRPCDEETVLSLAAAFERNTEYHKLGPPILEPVS